MSILGRNAVTCGDIELSKGWLGPVILDGRDAVFDVFDLLPSGWLAVPVGS
jgi:hypothetical protein